MFRGEDKAWRWKEKGLGYDAMGSHSWRDHLMASQRETQADRKVVEPRGGGT